MTRAQTTNQGLALWCLFEGPVAETSKEAVCEQKEDCHRLDTNGLAGVDSHFPATDYVLPKGWRKRSVAGTRFTVLSCR